MASFASQPTQFTPYIAPTDLQAQAQRDQQQLQAQVQVGTHAQEMYNVNAQKIQGMIDSIAGLQVSKDVDKQYLNQAIGDFKNSMQTLVKSDFAKSQIFNQAGSLASKVAGDPKIQNAVISTQHEQDAIAQIQQMNKDGKGSKTNDNMLIRQIQQWRNDPNPGATLGKQSYTPFFDYQKGFQDFMKDKHGDVIVKQDPFTKNEDGSPNWRAYALVDGKQVELTPLQVQQDAQTYFTSNAQAKGQLDIDSTYFSDTTDTNQAFQRYQQANQQGILSMQNEIKRLNSDTALNPLNSKINQDNITQYQQAISKAQALNQANEQAFLQNPEAAKMGLFQNQVLQGFGQRFAYKDIENKIVKNPIFDAELDLQKLDLQRQKFEWDKESFNKNFDLEERKMQNAIRAAQISSGIAVTTGFDAKTAEAYTPKQYENDLKTASHDVFQNQLQTLYNTGAYNDIVELSQDSTGNTVYKPKQGVTQEQFQNAWTQAKKSYVDNPQGASRALKEYYENGVGDQSGVGKERVYWAEAKRFNDINSQIDEKFRGDPNYQTYKQIEANIGDPNQALAVLNNSDLGTPNGVVTRADIIKYVQQKQGAKNVDIPDRVKNTIDKIIEDVHHVGDPEYSNFRKEVDRISSALGSNKDIYNTYKDQISQTFKNIAPNKSSISVSEKINDKNANKLAALTTFASGIGKNKADEIAAVTGQKQAGDIYIGATKNPVTGQVTAFVRNSKGATATIDVDNITAGQLEPSLMETDPYAGQQRILDANQGRFRGVKTTTGPNGLDSYLPQNSNLKKYSMRYQIERSADGRGYAPVPEYSPKGSGQWIPLPYQSKYFGSLAEANNWVNQIAAKGDTYLENTFLNQ